MENSGLSVKEEMKVQRGEACHPGLHSCKGRAGHEHSGPNLKACS